MEVCPKHSYHLLFRKWLLNDPHRELVRLF
jgi:hypothetical protein